MDSRTKYAPIEDVVSALEIILEDHIEDDMLSKIFSINNAFKVINFGCIKETDQILVMTNYYEIMSWIISYTYVPDNIIIITAHTNCYYGKVKWEDFHLLLTGYQYTKPILTCDENILAECPEQVFDVAIVGLLNPFDLQLEKPMNRFYLDAGVDYEFFEQSLIKASKDLKDNGVLIILSKPGWVLKIWDMLDTLALQLDYNNYKLYVDNDRNPNTFIWLRFIKNMKESNLELNKNNLLNLMRDNNIDRLFAHRNKLLFPYVELQEYNSDAYVDLSQNTEYMQYFFNLETTRNLSKLCGNYTACLVTPSVAQHAHKEGKNIVLFERDNRFRENGGLRFIKYDLHKGLTKLLYTRYLNKFDRVICDPPFNIRLDILSKDVAELLKNDNSSIAYIIFPNKDKASLINAMKRNKMYLIDEPNQISIEYARPPKIVRIHGKDAIQLYKFSFVM